MSWENMAEMPVNITDLEQTICPLLIDCKKLKTSTNYLIKCRSMDELHSQQYKRISSVWRKKNPMVVNCNTLEEYTILRCTSIHYKDCAYYHDENTKCGIGVLFE